MYKENSCKVSCLEWNEWKNKKKQIALALIFYSISCFFTEFSSFISSNSLASMKVSTWVSCGPWPSIPHEKFKCNATCIPLNAKVFWRKHVSPKKKIHFWQKKIEKTPGFFTHTYQYGNNYIFFILKKSYRMCVSMCIVVNATKCYMMKCSTLMEPFAWYACFLRL